MKKYLIITLAVLAAVACASCEAADDTDFDPDFAGSIISFAAASNVSGVAPVNYSWGQNTSSKAAVSGNTMTLSASRNNSTGSPSISMTITKGANDSFNSSQPWSVDATIVTPDGTYTGTVAVIITDIGNIAGGFVQGTFTGAVTKGNEALAITAGVINLKRLS